MKGKRQSKPATTKFKTLQSRIKYARIARSIYPKEKKTSIRIPAITRLEGPTNSVPVVGEERGKNKVFAFGHISLLIT